MTLDELLARGWRDPPTDDEFDRLAASIFAAQYEAVAPYRRLCDGRGKTPETVAGWRDAPLVPTAAFKEADLSPVDADRAERVFETSGTTEGRPGRHLLPTTRWYRAGLGPTFARYCLPDRPTIPMAILAPTARAAPRSSLSFMLDLLADAHGEGPTPFLVEGDRLDTDALARFAADADGPVLLFGTSFAFVYAIDALDPVALPPGSRIVDTGGTKGRSRAVDRAELLEAYERVFGVGPDHVVGEYGMSELSSQFYDRHLAEGGPIGVKAGGPWARVRIVDPVTLDERPAGESGLIAVFDALNAPTVSAILTGDLGVARPGGFEVLGRAPGAAPRGCSIAIDEMLGR